MGVFATNSEQGKFVVLRHVNEAAAGPVRLEHPVFPATAAVLLLTAEWGSNGSKDTTREDLPMLARTVYVRTWLCVCVLVVKMGKEILFRRLKRDRGIARKRGAGGRGRDESVGKRRKMWAL
ncbi:hypothetical protein K0M31_018085 [Melipona bicolor]|uniref:Uncharacterized protein n=1 Tax=Melipona bicolor TaxID=60889 RepID=A0AA40FD63_9HYME|nr:hypothetical protein K0M31_018085 [Melipona bicolor]